MKALNDQRALSDVARRHGWSKVPITVTPGPTAKLYHAAEMIGPLQIGLAVTAARALGVAIPSTVPNAMGLALVGDVIEYDGWSWDPAGSAVTYTHGTGDLVQVTGGGHSRIGFALSPTVLVICP